MTPTLFPPEALAWRKFRIAATALVFFLPSLTALVQPGYHFSVLGLVYPSLRRAVLLGIIAYHVYRLKNPEHLRPRTMEFWNTNWAGEVISVLGAWFIPGILMNLAGRQLVYLGPMVSYLGTQLLGGLLALTMLSPATRTVIDGEAQKATVWGLFPRTIPFASLPGLGTVEVRMLRNGSHVGTQHFVALFTGSGEPTKLRQLDAQGELAGQINLIAQHTGVPVARR